MEKLLVIKIGGNVIDNPEVLRQFLTTFTALAGHKILVHGGGKMATQIADRLGVETEMIEGRRLTDHSMLDVVTMVYGGLVNKTIVGLLQSLGCNAIGLTGADAGIICAQKRPVQEIDYGFVGDIETVNIPQIAYIIHGNMTPVVAPLTLDLESGSMLNTNADTMASAVAAAMSKQYDVNLIYCFEKKGVLSNPEDDESVIQKMTPDTYFHFKAAGVISKGMIPKLDNAFEALEKGVSQVIICHADDLAEAIETNNAGTQITGQ